MACSSCDRQHASVRCAGRHVRVTSNWRYCAGSTFVSRFLAFLCWLLIICNPTLTGTATSVGRSYITVSTSAASASARGRHACAATEGGRRAARLRPASSKLGDPARRIRRPSYRRRRRRRRIHRRSHSRRSSTSTSICHPSARGWAVSWALRSAEFRVVSSQFSQTLVLRLSLPTAARPVWRQGWARGSMARLLTTGRLPLWGEGGSGSAAPAQSGFASQTSSISTLSGTGMPPLPQQMRSKGQLLLLLAPAAAPLMACATKTESLVKPPQPPLRGASAQGRAGAAEPLLPLPRSSPPAAAAELGGALQRRQPRRGRRLAEAGAARTRGAVFCDCGGALPSWAGSRRRPMMVTWGCSSGRSLRRGGRRRPWRTWRDGGGGGNSRLRSAASQQQPCGCRPVGGKLQVDAKTAEEATDDRSTTQTTRQTQFNRSGHS